MKKSYLERVVTDEDLKLNPTNYSRFELAQCALLTPWTALQILCSGMCPFSAFVNGLHLYHFFAEFMLDTFMLVRAMVFANWYLYIALTVLLNFAD